MKVIQQYEFDGPEVLLYEEVPIPELKLAVQVAKWEGVRVIAVASGKHKALLHDLGEDLPSPVNVIY
jgi:NADPH:quinone reductase-like Zn-dependent oxidoreductase